MNTDKIFGVIKVSGDEAGKFLQGQLTNDINVLSSQPMIYAAYLNPKGRMLASFIITKTVDNEYLLLCPTDLIDYVVKRLSMFVMRSKVKISTTDYGVVLSNDVLSSSISSFPFWGKYCNIVDNSLSDETGFKLLLIQNGIPIIYLASIESVIPQQVNYDLLGGVNFKKGCYTGQEIVARTHYLGKVKRRMYNFDTEHLPTIGTIVTSPIMDNQEIGYIIDYVEYNGKFIGLVSAQIDCISELFTSNNEKLQNVTQIEYLTNI